MAMLKQRLKLHASNAPTLNNYHMKSFLQFIQEGGAAGHMAHPYDLPQVNTGNDLVKFFNEVAEQLEQDPSIASVKIDGFNVSFKYVGGQFAIDRGSMHPDDVAGITIDRLSHRFPEGHGMIPVGTKLLTILNDAVKTIRPELSKLGMIDDPTRFLNCEFVQGQTNVTKYSNSFIAIHGVNKFEQVTPKRRISKEIDYDRQALLDLIDKLQPIANKYKFQVFGSVPISEKDKSKISYNYTLQQRITLKTAKGTATKTLKQWLATATNPHTTKVKFKDGESRAALSFYAYTNIFQTRDITQYIDDPVKQKLVLDGFIFFHATRVLGNIVLKHFTTPMGDLDQHEGVVLRMPQYDNPVKITGDFMINRAQSAFFGQ